MNNNPSRGKQWRELAEALHGRAHKVRYPRLTARSKNELVGETLSAAWREWRPHVANGPANREIAVILSTLFANTGDSRAEHCLTLLRFVRREEREAEE